MIDTHVHFWRLGRVDYAVSPRADTLLYRGYQPEPSLPAPAWLPMRGASCGRDDARSLIKEFRS